MTTHSDFSGLPERRSTFCPLAVSLLLSLLLGACSAEPTQDTPLQDAGVSDGAAADVNAADADTSTTDDGVATDTFDSLPSEDLAPLQLLARARTASTTAAKATWPSASNAIWPGFSLHKAPTLLVILSTEGMPRRAYLVGAGNAPPGGISVTSAGLSEPVWRLDGAMKGMGPGETVVADHQLNGKSVLLATWSPLRDADDVVWLEQLGRGYMVRLREVEAFWQPVQACGQSVYPRFEEAIALLFLECAILREGLDATTPAEAQARLHDWGGARAAAIGVTNFVGQRARHYDNLFGSEQFVAGRLTVASGDRTTKQWRAELHKRLSAPAKIAVAEFDDLMLDSGVVSAAAAEVASIAGWNVEPSFHKGDNVMGVVSDKLGVAPAKALADAKARHDWAGFLKRAKAIMALPIGDGP